MHSSEPGHRAWVVAQAPGGPGRGVLVVRRTYRMSIESDIVEPVNFAAPKNQIRNGDSKQK
jgi:hypothetical protein